MSTLEIVAWLFATVAVGFGILWAAALWVGSRDVFGSDLP